MRLRRGHTQVRSSEQLEEQELLRDAEESLVAALQESDTAVEALGDTGADATGRASRRQWTIGAAGLVLAALGFMVARRRR
jgi:hypothetical protein